MCTTRRCRRRLDEVDLANEVHTWRKLGENPHNRLGWRRTNFVTVKSRVPAVLAHADTYVAHVRDRMCNISRMTLRKRRRLRTGKVRAPQNELPPPSDIIRRKVTWSLQAYPPSIRKDPQTVRVRINAHTHTHAMRLAPAYSMMIVRRALIPGPAPQRCVHEIVSSIRTRIRVPALLSSPASTTTISPGGSLLMHDAPACEGTRWLTNGCIATFIIQA